MFRSCTRNFSKLKTAIMPKNIFLQHPIMVDSVTLIQNPNTDPCKFCKGTGFMKCLSCKGEATYIYHEGKFFRSFNSCKNCVDGTQLCKFCGGDGKSYLTY